MVGAGLAGSEAAWQLARYGIPVRLVEMKPSRMTPAHHSSSFAELVCSNSFRGDRLENAVGLLKEELRMAGSLILSCADATKVEAGGALAVDRTAFSQMVTRKIRENPKIAIDESELSDLPQPPFIIATGPLTTEKLCKAVQAYFPKAEYLNFFDAAAPLVSYESIDMECAWFASRYDRGTPDYINCPMSREEYEIFVAELASAEMAEVHGFEDNMVFDGCMPVEVMARRGIDTLRYGPLKPVGLKNPKTGKEPYAVVQLRKDNSSGTIYNIVGFQTHLKFSEQKRVFSMIPALKEAAFLRYGVMHKNTFLHSPGLLDRYYSDLRNPFAAFAGQFTGVEGYVESTASGFLAGTAMALRLLGRNLPDFTRKTAIGALGYYVSDTTIAEFQPMNVNFGIIDPLGYRVKGKANKNLEISMRGLETLKSVLSELGLNEDESNC